jgi:hypothetical protein
MCTYTNAANKGNYIMATRSTIALEYADGTVDQIYCHWDGYLEHNGKILQESWQDPFKVQEMMNLGDMSALGNFIGEKHDFNDIDDRGCTFYGRDRGEEKVSAKRFVNFDAYRLSRECEEYNYILRTDGKWYFSVNEEMYYVPLTLEMFTAAA